MSKSNSKSILSINYEQGYVQLHSDGQFIIVGDVKWAAYAFVKHVQDNIGEALSITFNRSVKANRILTGKTKYTLQWIHNQGAKKPEQWEKFAQEYERIWKLKAFA